jgi:hypothetical protein
MSTLEILALMIIPGGLPGSPRESTGQLCVPNAAGRCWMPH